MIVTGSHRSGTTWVGRMLDAHPQLQYVHEPLNCNVTPATRGVMPAKLDHWYQHIGEHNEARFLGPFRRLVAFRYDINAALESIDAHAPYTGAEIKVIERYAQFASAALQGCSALIKDPFALVSLPWFVRRLGARPVLMIRHPAAFVSSLLRLGWNFGLGDFLAQPELLERHPIPREDLNLHERVRDGADPVRSAALGWKYLHRMILRYRHEHPDWIYLRHEDLSTDPENGVVRLLARLGLPPSSEVIDFARASSSRENPVEMAPGRHHEVAIDSRSSVRNWTRRLSGEQIKAIRDTVAELGQAFYGDEEW